MNAHDSSNQVLFTASAMFAAIVAAVVVSTLLVMTLMKGEFASAVSEIQNNPTTSQVAQVSSDDAVCTGSYSSEAEGDEASSPNVNQSAKVDAKHVRRAPSGGIVNSYNSTNNNTSNVTNNVTKTKTVTKNNSKSVVNNVDVRDSFNINSNNQVASNNTVNSGNTTNTAVNSNNTTVDSNNTVNTNVNSNNTSVDSHDIDVNESVIVLL